MGPDCQIVDFAKLMQAHQVISMVWTVLTYVGGVFVVLWMANGDCHEIKGGGGVAMSIVGYVANGDIHGVDRFVCDRVSVAL